MQTLGLTDSAPRTEGRLKSLFWPSIKTGDDVDYLGTQGFWVLHPGGNFIVRGVRIYGPGDSRGHSTAIFLFRRRGCARTQPLRRSRGADLVSRGHDSERADCRARGYLCRPLFQSPRDVDCFHVES